MSTFNRSLGGRYNLENLAGAWITRPLFGPELRSLGPEFSQTTINLQVYKSILSVLRSEGHTYKIAAVLRAVNTLHCDHFSTKIVAMSNMPTQRPTTSASAPKPQSILIVGCGIAGPVLASLLLQSPGPASSLPHITILERNPSSISSGQNIDIRGIGKQIIRFLDLEDEIKRSTTGEEGVRFVDENNRCWAEFAVDKSGKVETGTSDVEILRGRLAEILLDKTKRDSKDVQDRGGKGVEFLFEESLESLHQDEEKAHIQLAKGGERSFDLVVGADGLHSRTRKLAFGNEAEFCLKKLHMFAAFFSIPKEDEDGEWRSWFHAPGGVSIMLRPSGTKEKSTVLILLADKSGIIADQLAGSERSVSAQKKLVMSKLNRIGWQEQRLTKAVEAADDFYFDVTAQVNLAKWSHGRVVLLGDAGQVYLT